MSHFIYTMKGLGKIYPPDQKVFEDIWLSFIYGAKIGIIGGNGAGKSTLMHTLAGAHPADSGQILVNGQPVTIHNPREARHYGIEVIYQKLALADNIDAAGNLFLGRELRTSSGALDDSAMASATSSCRSEYWSPMLRTIVSPVDSMWARVPRCTNGSPRSPRAGSACCSCRATCRSCWRSRIASSC